MPQIIGSRITEKGLLEWGERDPATGKRFERLTPTRLLDEQGKPKVPVVKPKPLTILEQMQQRLAGFGKQVELIAGKASTIAEAQEAGYKGVVYEEAQKFLKPVPVTPTTADLVEEEVPEIPPPLEPSVTSSYTQGLIDDLENKRKALEDDYDKRLTDIRTQKTTLETKISDLLAKQEDILEEKVEPLLRPFRESLEKTERQRLKIEENFFANQNSVQELETLLTQARAEILAAEGITGLASIREPRIAKLKEDMAGRIGVIEAVMASRNNQITVAENMIDRSITAIEADRKDRLGYYETLLNFYETQRDEEGKRLIVLTADEKDFMEREISLIKGDLDTAQATTDYIKSLLLDPETAGLMEQAGIKINDPVETINKKLSDTVYKQERDSTITDYGEQGYKYLPLEEQWTAKEEEDLLRVKDSRGIEMVFWKKPEIKEPFTPYQLYQIEKQKILSPTEAAAVGVPYGTTREEAMKMGIIPKKITEVEFTPTQIAKGSAEAGMSIKDFQTLDTDTQNLYISGPVADMKKEIRRQIVDEYGNPSDIERDVSELEIPDVLKDTLTRYLWSIVE